MPAVVRLIASLTPNNPEIIKGFDVDIIHAVAEVMGKRAVFCTKQL
jgi:hypothetical protein